MGKNKVFMSVGLLLAILAVGWFAMPRGEKKAEETKIITNEADSSLALPVDPDSDVKEMVVEGMGEAREILVKGDEFKFFPANISVTKGESIHLIFENVGTTSHDFQIEGLGISTAIIPSGETDTVDFVVNKSGTYSFYCGVGNHRALGMEGELKAE